MADPALHFEDGQVEVTRLVVGPIDNNVFVVRCHQTGEALLIDAANEAEKVLYLCRSLGVKQVVETHGHWDHVQAVPEVRQAGYRVAVAAADARMLPGYDDLIEDGSVYEVGRLRVRAMHTPGHTPGSVCFVVEGSPVVFSGDTLFRGGPGSTRWPYSDFDAIIRSIEERLFTLPEDTIVMPGHGADTTIGAERPQLGEWIAWGSDAET